MAELRLTDFSGGMSDYYVDGRQNTARKLRNCLIDRQGQPYVRPGSGIWGRIPNQSEIKQAFLFPKDVTGDYMSYVTDAKLYYQQILSSVTTINETTFADGSAVALASGGVPVMASDRAHLYYARGTTRVTKSIFPQGSSVLRTMEAGLPKMTTGNVGITLNVVAGASTISHNYYIVLKRTYTVGGVTFIDRSIPLLIPPGAYDTLGMGTSVSFTGQPIGGGGFSSVDFAFTFGSFLEDLFIAVPGGVISVEIYRTKDGGTIPYLGPGASTFLPTVTDGTTDAQIGGFEPLYTFSGAVGTGVPPAAKYLAIVNNIGWYGNSVQNTHEFVSAGPSTTTTYGPNVLHQSVPGDPDGVPEDFFLEFDDEITAVAGIDVHPLVFEKNNVWRIEGQFGVDGSGSPVKRRIADGIGCIAHNSIVNIEGRIVFAGPDQFYMTDGFTVKPFSPQIKETYRQWYGSSADAAKIRSTYVPQERRAYWAMGGNNDATANRNVTALVLNHDHTAETGCFTEIGGEHYDTATLVGTTTKTLKRPEFVAVASFLDGRLVRTDAGGYIYYHEPAFTSDPVRDDSSGTTSAWIRSPVVMDIVTASWSFGTETMKKWFTDCEISLAPIQELMSQPGQRATRSGSVLKIGPGVKDIFTLGNALSATGFRQSYYIYLSCDRFKIPRQITTVTTASGVISLTLPSISGVPEGVPLDYFVTIGPGYTGADLSTARDNTEDFRPMKVVSHRTLTAANQLHIASRYFPKGTLRSTYKQMRIKSPYRTLYKSDDYGLADLTNVGTYGTAVIGAWPSSGNIYGHWLHVASDNYAAQYRIFSATATTLQVDNALGSFPTATGVKWEIRGYDKDIRQALNGATITYQPYGQSIAPYTAAEGNQNA